MQVFFLVINKVSLVDELLKEFVAVGIQGATIIDSTGMGRALMNSDEEVPIFSDLRMMLNDAKPFNKTIFIVLEEEQIPLVVDTVRKVAGDLSNPDMGIMFTVPIHYLGGGSFRKA
jgi:nitrogen regulatory protein PII